MPLGPIDPPPSNAHSQKYVAAVSRYLPDTFTLTFTRTFTSVPSFTLISRKRQFKTAWNPPPVGFSRLAPSFIARKPARDYASLQALMCLWSPSGRPISLRFNLFTEVSRRSQFTFRTESIEIHSGLTADFRVAIPAPKKRHYRR